MYNIVSMQSYFQGSVHLTNESPSVVHCSWLYFLLLGDQMLTSLPSEEPAEQHNVRTKEQGQLLL